MTAEKWYEAEMIELKIEVDASLKNKLMSEWGRVVWRECRQFALAWDQVINQYF